MSKQKDFKWQHDDFEWRYQPSESSLIADVLSYIQNRNLHPSQTKTEMLLKALTAFYTSETLLVKENSPESLLAVKNALRVLFDQFMRGCAEWKIDPASIGGSALTSISSFSRAQFEADSLAETEIEEDDLDATEWNLSGMTLHDKVYN